MRVLRGLACLLVVSALSTSVVSAEDRTFIVSWDHPAGGPKPNHYVIGWGNASGMYQSNMQLKYPATSLMIRLTNLQPGQTIYFAAISCDLNNDCSLLWSNEAVHTVVADGTRNPPDPPENFRIGVVQ